MGGTGSTRWGWHSRKTQVEDCFKLPVTALYSYLVPGNWCSLHWRRGGEQTGQIRFKVEGDDFPEVVRLIYTISAKSGNPVDYDYPVRLTSTSLAWGKSRYWFSCPAIGCGRRVGCLYLPPGGKYFACRHCYNLSYASRQDAYQDSMIFDFIAESLRDEYPSFTRKDVKRILEW